MNLAPGSLLSQVQCTAGATLAFSANHQTEIQRVVVTNVLAGNDKYSLWHADEGQAASDGCALYVSNPISGNTTLTIVEADSGMGISVKAGGRLYVGCSGTSAVTFSLYGVTRPAR